MIFDNNYNNLALSIITHIDLYNKHSKNLLFILTYKYIIRIVYSESFPFHLLSYILASNMKLQEIQLIQKIFSDIVTIVFPRG